MEGSEKTGQRVEAQEVNMALRLMKFGLVIAVFLTACATPYQPKGFTGGYEEAEIQPGVYFLEFLGNGYTSLPTVVKYWHQRANEVCAAKGQVPEIIDVTRGRELAFIQGTSIRKPAQAGHFLCVSPSSSGQVQKGWDLSSYVSVAQVLMPPRISVRVHRIAVVPLSAISGNEVPSYIDFAVNFIRQRQPGLMLVERDAMGKIVEEALIQHSGRIDDETTVRIGKMIGADSLLTYRIEPIDVSALPRIRASGGAVVGSVEIRVIQIEKGLALFRQLSTATTLLPQPGKGAVWPDEPVYRAHKVSVEYAASYGLSALVAAFGENPLGAVPALDLRDQGLIVLGVLHGSPAQTAGLKKGDRIITINGRPMRAWTDPVQLPATLTFERHGKTEQVSVRPNGP